MGNVRYAPGSKWKRAIDDLSPLGFWRQRMTAFLLQKPMVKMMERRGQYGKVNDQMRAGMPVSDFGRDRFGDYVPGAHDVVIATFPKSGTNWLMQMVHQVANDGQGEFEHIYDVVPWPDGEVVETVSLHDMDAVQQSPHGMRAVKAHLGWEGIPYNPEARYIYLVRDPKDVFVSNYHFFRDVGFGPLMPEPETWLDYYLSHEFLMGSWAEHLAGFWAQRHRDNVLVLTYESLKGDPDAAITTVADYMGVSLSQEAFERVQHKTSFEYMKQHDAKFNTGPVTPNGFGKGHMMRKGQNGASGELLSRAQQARIDAYFMEELERLGSDFPYEEHFTVVQQAHAR